MHNANSSLTIALIRKGEITKIKTRFVLRFHIDDFTMIFLSLNVITICTFARYWIVCKQVVNNVGPLITRLLNQQLIPVLPWRHGHDLSRTTSYKGSVFNIINQLSTIAHSDTLYSRRASIPFLISSKRINLFKQKW